MHIQTQKLALGLLAVAALFFLFFYRLDALGLTGPDEPRYAEVAKEMFLSHDYVTPRLLGQPWFEKPILYYWCAAAFYSLLGTNETAARLPSALSALALVAFVFVTTRRSLDFHARWLSAMILATSLSMAAFSHAASTDMLLTATFSMAMLAFFVILTNPESSFSASLLAVGYAFLGLSVLAKGPVGIALAALILAGFFWMTGEWRLIKKLHILLGMGIVFLVAGPWYWFCYRANGWTFIETFLVQHNLMRFATNEFQHSRPFWFFVPVILAGLLPWTFLFTLPASQARRLWRRRFWRSRPDVTYLVLWITVPFLFFTLAQSKLPGYILPIVIPLSLALGRAIPFAPENSLKHPSRDKKLSALRWAYLFEMVFLVWIFFSRNRMLSRFQLPAYKTSFWIGLVCCLFVGTLVICFFVRRGVFILCLAHILLVPVLVFAASRWILPQVDLELSTRPAARAILQSAPAAKVFTYGVPRAVQYGLNFYLSPPPASLESLPEKSGGLAKDTVFLVVSPKKLGVESSKWFDGATLIFQSREIWVFKFGTGREQRKQSMEFQKIAR